MGDARTTGCVQIFIDIFSPEPRAPDLPFSRLKRFWAKKQASPVKGRSKTGTRTARHNFFFEHNKVPSVINRFMGNKKKHRKWGNTISSQNSDETKKSISALLFLYCYSPRNGDGCADLSFSDSFSGFFFLSSLSLFFLSSFSFFLSLAPNSVLKQNR